MCLCDDEKVHVSKFLRDSIELRAFFSLTIEIQTRGKHFKNENRIVYIIYLQSRCKKRSKNRKQNTLRCWKMFY